MTDTILPNNLRKLKVIDVAVGGDYNDLASSRGQIGDLPTPSASCDLNTLVKNGRYWVNKTGQTNGPDVAGTCVVNTYGEGVIQQTFETYVPSGSTDTDKVIYSRNSSDNGTTWTSWINLISEQELCNVLKELILENGGTQAEIDALG